MRRISIAAALLIMAARGAQAQDGLAELKRVQQTYMGMKSYSQKVSSTMATRVNGKSGVSGQTSELRFQQPNRIYIQVSSPEAGTVVSYNAGTEMLVYRGKINAYQKRPAQPSVKAYVKSLKEFGIGTMLDPLAFLTGEPIQSVIASASVKGVDTLDGTKCDLVMAKLSPAIAGKAKFAEATFWVDKAQSVLRKVKIVMTGIPGTARMRTVEKGKPVVKQVALLVDTTISMTMQDVKVNPPLADSSFTYALPKSAIEQNPETMLKK